VPLQRQGGKKGIYRLAESGSYSNPLGKETQHGGLPLASTPGAVSHVAKKAKYILRQEQDLKMMFGKNFLGERILPSFHTLDG
jgi:hypothetical protein